MKKEGSLGWQESLRGLRESRVEEEERVNREGEREGPRARGVEGEYTGRRERERDVERRTEGGEGEGRWME